ncbi:15341_t:CDS:2 [Rhizophagus irregularis]|nr:15341_t:CDS:2 [Rhizophagus irregularis]
MSKELKPGTFEPKKAGRKFPEPFSDKEASLDNSGSLDYNKDAKKDVEIDISTSNIKEQTLTVKDFNLIIETFRKFLKGTDFSDKSDKSLIYNKSYQYSIFEDLIPDVSTYNIFMSTALNFGDLSKFTRFNIKPDVQIYNVLLNVLMYDSDGLIRATILREEKERAKEFFREMESEGIKPNVLILDSLGITGLDAIQKLQDSNGVNLNLLDYNTLLRGCLKKSEYDDAIKIFNIMQENEVYPSLATYTILTGAYLQNNEIEKAIELFNRMKNDNFKKSEVIRLLDSASKLEDNKVIEKLFHTISKTESQLSNVAFEKILWRVAQGDYYLNNREKCNIPTRNTISIIDGFIQKDDDKILYTGINV